MYEWLMKPSTEKTTKDTYNTKDTYDTKVTIDNIDIINSKEINNTNNFNKEIKSIQIKNVSFLEFEISQKKLQEAVIWTEILGQPMCKRRKRR